MPASFGEGGAQGALPPVGARRPTLIRVALALSTEGGEMRKGREVLVEITPPQASPGPGRGVEPGLGRFRAGAVRSVHGHATRRGYEAARGPTSGPEGALGSAPVAPLIGPLATCLATAPTEEGPSLRGGGS